MAPKNEDKKHYWMASVTISFVHEDSPMDTSINALTTNKDQCITYLGLPYWGYKSAGYN